MLDADADTFYIFLSTPSARRATEEVRLTEYDTGISIHALREEGDLWDRLRQLRITISIHALREEGDAAPDGVFLFLSHFYPRPPRGGRHIVEINEHIRKLFLSTPSARRATCALQGLCQNHREISIHALREEGDHGKQLINAHPRIFLSTPSARRATSSVVLPPCAFQFLSTPSARRATVDLADFHHPAENFYPRPPRGGRPTIRQQPGRYAKFLSTPSARRATSRFRIFLHSGEHFYPRPPRGGRPFCTDCGIIISTFLSTPSARRATRTAVFPRRGQEISIHALREEGDQITPPTRGWTKQFLSTPSARRATPLPSGQGVYCCIFLSTPSARRATTLAPVWYHTYAISIHALREEGD